MENIKQVKVTVEQEPVKEEIIAHDQTFFSCGCFGGGGTRPTPSN